MRTRYEIEVIRLRDGRLYLRLYDDYWDRVMGATLDTASKSPSLKGEAAIHRAFGKVGGQLANLRPGCWYALRMPKEVYPFGTPTALERIPGRRMVYKPE